MPKRSGSPRTEQLTEEHRATDLQHLHELQPQELNQETGQTNPSGPDLADQIIAEIAATDAAIRNATAQATAQAIESISAREAEFKDELATKALDTRAVTNLSPGLPESLQGLPDPPLPKPAPRPLPPARIGQVRNCTVIALDGKQYKISTADLPSSGLPKDIFPILIEKFPEATTLPPQLQLIEELQDGHPEHSTGASPNSN